MPICFFFKQQHLEGKQVGVILDVLVAYMFAFLAFFKLELSGMDCELEWLTAVHALFYHYF